MSKSKNKDVVEEVIYPNYESSCCGVGVMVAGGWADTHYLCNKCDKRCDFVKAKPKDKAIRKYHYEYKLIHTCKTDINGNGVCCCCRYQKIRVYET